MSDRDDAASPRIGVRLHGGLPAARCIELARIAEASGFAAVWFAENPFNRGVLPAAAACAAATTRIRIGIGVFNPFNRHPTLIAMEIGALDELAQGRVALGIGSGIGAAVERMGFRYDRPLGAVRDAVAIVRGLLAGDRVTYTGRVFSARDVQLDYRPHRPDVPILTAGRGEQSLRLCGQIADGLVISNICTPGFTASAVDAVRRAAADAGRPAPAEFVQYVPCAARPDRADAVRAAKEALGEMLPGFWSLGGRFPAAKAAMLRDSDIDEAAFDVVVARLRSGDPATAVLDDRFVEAFAVAGTAEDCLARIAAYGRAGVTEVILTFVGGRAAEDMAYVGRAVTRHDARPG